MYTYVYIYSDQDMEEILITITAISATGHRVIADIYIFITFFLFYYSIYVPLPSTSNSVVINTCLVG